MSKFIKCDFQVQLHSPVAETKPQIQPNESPSQETPMSVISKTGSDSSKIFSVTAATKGCEWAGAPHLGSSCCAIDVRWVCIKMKGCSSSVCSRQTLFFHQLFPIAFNISCWEKRNQREKISVYVDEVHSYSSPL